MIHIGTSFEFAAAPSVFYKIPCKVRLGKLNTRIDLDRIHPLRCRKPRFICRDSKIPFTILFLKRKLDILRNISVRIFHQRGCDAAEKMLFFFRVRKLLWILIIKKEHVIFCYIKNVATFSIIRLDPVGECILFHRIQQDNIFLDP